MSTCLRRAVLVVLVALALGSASWAQAPTVVQQAAARLDSAAQYATNAATGGTMTLTPNGGEFVYIYSLEVSGCSNATGGTVAGVLSVTGTTNLTGTPVWTVGTGSTTVNAPGGPGKCNPFLSIVYPTGLRATAPGEAVVVTNATFAANMAVRVNIGWRSAP